MNKNVLFFLFDNIYLRGKAGVYNKVKGQISALKQMGYNVDLVSFAQKNRLFFNKKEILKVPSKTLFLRIFIFGKIISEVKKNPLYDFIYIRYFLSSPFFILFLRQLKKRGVKIVLELPTYPYDDEIKATNFIEKINIFLDRVTRKLLKKYVFLCACPTYDQEIFGIPTVKINNGIIVENINIVRSKEKNTKKIKLIGVANLSIWHGYDRIITGLGLYYKQKKRDIDVFFTVIGEGKELNNLKALVAKLNLRKYVQFAGIQTGAALDTYFNKADIAVSSLGLHRIGLKKGSTIKTGEYLARGLPVIFSYDDETIQDLLPFILKVEANDDPVNMETVISFYRKLNISPENIRKFAKKHLDWKIQMKNITDRL